MAARQDLPPLEIPATHTWRVGIVRAVYNESVTGEMLQQAQSCLDPAVSPHRRLRERPHVREGRGSTDGP